jgi:nucleoside phosphorylase
VSQYDFGVVCAKELELAAAELAFGATKGRGDERGVLVCTLACDGGELRGILAPVSKQGELAASAAAIRLIREYATPRLVITGVAAGVPAPGKPEDHVRLGDVVVADKVVKFDEVKQNDGQPVHRGVTALPDSQMLRTARLLVARHMASGASPWQATIEAVVAKNPRFARPDAATDAFRLDGSGRYGTHPEQPDRSLGLPLPRVGAVGSSAALVKDARLRNRLATQHGLIAIEMEAAGVAQGTWEESASYLFAKGVCDYGDRDKKDLWQRYAALASASFARSVLEAALVARPAAAVDAAVDRADRIDSLCRRIAPLNAAQFARLKLLLDAATRGFDCEGGAARCAVELVAWAEGTVGLGAVQSALERVAGKQRS